MRFHPGVHAARNVPDARIGFEPGLSALFSRTGNDVEAPELLSRLRVVGDDIAGDVHRPLFVDRRARKVRRGARVHRDRGDQDVADDRGGRRIRYAPFVRQLRPLVPPQVRGEVDDALGAEVLHLPSGLGIERDQHVAGHHDEYPLVAAPVGPVADPATRASRQRIDNVGPSRQLTGGAPLPQQLPGGRIESRHVAVHSRRRVHHAVDDQGTDLRRDWRPRSEVPCRKTPRDLKIADVGGVDLIGGRIWVAPLSAPKNRHSVSAVDRPWVACPDRPVDTP